MHSQESYYIALNGLPDAVERQRVTAWLFERVFRTRFERPGFALLSLEFAVSSQELRNFMVALKQDLGGCYHLVTGRYLAYRSISRFDQQTTTRFHLDGAPDESYLMLGYEPSEVACEVWAADYSQAARERNIDPIRYLAEYNPMLTQWEAQLLPYSTQIKAFDPRFPQILLLNNSRLPHSEAGVGSQGVMHKATILTPQPDKSRIINSTLLISVENPADEPVSSAEQQAFLQID